MCKFCEIVKGGNLEYLENVTMKDDHVLFIDTENDKPIIRITNYDSWDTNTRVEIDYCPICGEKLK